MAARIFPKGRREFLLDGALTAAGDDGKVSEMERTLGGGDLGKFTPK